MFDPQRWYDERAKNLSPWVIVFGVGKRACVGQNLAKMNVLKMATTLFKAYEFEFLGTEQPMLLVCHGDSDLRTPVMVRCKRRGEPFAG